MKAELAEVSTVIERRRRLRHCSLLLAHRFELFNAGRTQGDTRENGYSQLQIKDYLPKQFNYTRNEENEKEEE